MRKQSKKMRGMERAISGQKVIEEQMDMLGLRETKCR